MSLEQIAQYDTKRWQDVAANARQNIETRLFIDGDWADAADSGRFETIDPSNGEVLAAMAAGTGADIDRAVAAARKAFYSGCWSRMEPRERMAVLYRLKAVGDRVVLLDSMAVLAAPIPPTSG